MVKTRQTLIDRQYIAGITAAISVAASGTCFAWVAPTMKYFMNEDSDIFMTSSQISWMIAFLEVGNFLCDLLSGVLADMWGRKPTILLSGPLYAITWLVLLFTTNYTIICLMRVIQGIAMGIVFTVVPLYLGEISSPSHRGSITGLFSIAWIFGYLIEYCIGPYVSYKLFTTITATLPIIFFILFSLQPESPYFLLMKGKHEQAAANLLWLRGANSQEEIQVELEDMKRSVQEDLNNATTFSDVIRSPADRRALLVILIIGSVCMLSGPLPIMSYSTHLFTQSGIKFISPDVLTIIMGLTMFLGGFVNTFVVDSLGRRPLIFCSCIGSFILSAVTGIYFYVNAKVTTDITRYSWIVPLSVILNCLFSVVGIFPVSMTYKSELFTNNTRGIAASISSINSTIASFICVKLYQIIGDNFGLYTIYWLFSLVCLIGLILLYIFAPETKGKTFSEIRNELCNLTDSNKNTIKDLVTIRDIGLVNKAYDA